MITLLLAAPLWAGTTRLCAETEANASANGAWEVLGQDGRDGELDTREGAQNARAYVHVQFGGERSEDLCPTFDPMGGIAIATRTEMLEVELPKPGGAPANGCFTTGMASANGNAEGLAWVDASRLSAKAMGRSTMEIAVTNASDMDVSGGAGGAFTGEWSYRTSGPNTRVAGTVTIGLADAYAGGTISIPGVLHAEAWEGKVSAWSRQGDHYVRYDGAAPVTLEVEAILPGRAGTLCAQGSATVGARGSADNGGFDSLSEVGMTLTVAGTPKAVPDRTVGDEPSFAPCGCR